MKRGEYKRLEFGFYAGEIIPEASGLSAVEKLLGERQGYQRYRKGYAVAVFSFKHAPVALLEQFHHVLSLRSIPFSVEIREESFEETIFAESGEYAVAVGIFQYFFQLKRHSGT